MSHVTNANLKRKRQIVYVMGGCCQVCGYSKSINALELHHINPKEKIFSFGKEKNKAWDLIIEELKKCVLVCANCHREIESGECSKHISSSFDENRVNEISKQIIDIKNKKLFYCKNCGEVISYKSIYCTKCNGKVHRKVERPSRETLKLEIRTYPFTKLAEKYCVTDNAIRKWCKNYNLPSKKKDIIKYTEEDWLKI